MGRGGPADDGASWWSALRAGFARPGIGRRGGVWARVARDPHVRRLLELAADGACAVDREGRVVVANAAAARLLGWEVEELIGRTLHEVVNATHARPACPIRAALATGELQRDDEVVFRRRDGTPLPVEFTVAPVVEEGGIQGMLVTFRDIGAWKRAERLLAESPAVVYAGRVVEGRVAVEWVSAGVEGLAGCTAAEALEAGWWEGRLHPEDREHAIARRAELPERKVLAQDYRVAHRDGSWRWVHDELRVVEGGADGGAAVIGAWTDITALKEREAEQRQAQKMEAVGRLARGIAHDFNNLLTAIRGYAKFLLQDLPAESAQRKDVESIQRATDRAAALTQQLRAVGRRLALQPRVVELNGLVSGLREVLQRMAGAGVEVVVEPAAEPLRVLADASQLEQVILNLVANARDAVEGDGRVEVRTSRVRVERAETLAAGRLEPGDYHALAVADTGSGIPGAVLPQIFDPFFTTKPRGQGTGLGLATVYGIVMQSGGAVRVESEPGRGTTFTVYLQAATGGGGTAAEPEAGGRGAGTVLLVDDEADVRRVTRRILEAGGYRVLEAANGAEALERATSHDGPVDLLLADVELPRSSGPALAESIRGVRPGIAVLFMSGCVAEPATPGTGGAGRTAFLEKPFAPEALIERVRQLIESRAEA